MPDWLHRSGTVVLSIVALLVLAAPPGSAADTRDLDGAVRGYAAEFAVPAVVAGVVARNGEVATVAHGTTSDGAPATADTRFRIASMSKAFTAVAVLQLAERGRLRLDQPVAELIPGFTVADPRGSAITVRHLLAHTSGLSNADVDEFALPPQPSAAALVDRLRSVPLATAPGTAHEYLNSNYDVAARIVEVTTGRPFGDHLRDAVLLPLGMTSTVATDRCDARVPGLPLGHTGALGLQVPVPEIPSLCAGDGGVVSTAGDMTRWVRFQLGTVPGPVSPAALAETHTPAPGTGGRYGLGWSVRTGPDGRPRVLHGGEIATWTSGIELSPDGSGAFVLTDGRGAPGVLATRLTALADGRDPGPPPADPLRTENLVLLGLAAVAAALLLTAVLRAGRRARRGRRPLSAPALAVVAGVGLLPALWAVAMGPPSATSWVLLVWMRPMAAVLALVLLLGGIAALVARRRATMSACSSGTSPGRGSGSGTRSTERATSSSS